MAKEIGVKEKIILTAETEIINSGYENTSLNDIIHRSGVSKGTFYHYFESKDGLLDQIMRRMSGAMLIPFKKVVNDPSLSAVEKFNAIVSSSTKYKIANKKLFRTATRWLWKDENIKIRHKLLNKNIKYIIPELAKIVDQGMKEKSFKVEYPVEAAESIIHLSMSLGEQMAPYIFNSKPNKKTIQIVLIKMKAYDDTVERILGAEKGSLKIYNEEAVMEIFKE